MRSLLNELNDPAIQDVSAFRIFDNVSYVGLNWVSSYVIETERGLVLIDSLYGNWTSHIVKGLRSLGLDPADIRFVICTQGQFDHCGGARYFQLKYNASVLMTAEDVELASSEQEDNRLKFPLADYTLVSDGDVLDMGDNQIVFVKSEDTPGMLTLVYDAKDGNETHTAVTIGGTSTLKTHTEKERYLDGIERLISFEQDVSVNLPSHHGDAELFERTRQLRERSAGEPHVMVDAAAYRSNLAARRDQAIEHLNTDDDGNTLQMIASAITSVVRLF